MERTAQERKELLLEFLGISEEALFGIPTPPELKSFCDKMGVKNSYLAAIAGVSERSARRWVTDNPNKTHAISKSTWILLLILTKILTVCTQGGGEAKLIVKDTGEKYLLEDLPLIFPYPDFLFERLNQ